MPLRENSPVLNSKLKILVPIGLVVIFLLFVGFMAITQEADEDFVLDDMPLDDMLADFSEEGEEEPPPVWEPLGPPRWFRSNAGGMTLEEIPSRLAALRNKYALVIDYVPPGEIEPRLLPYYQSDYTIEIRVLYEEGAEVRRQWLFRDESGITRLNAVFVPPREEEPEETELEETELELEETEIALEEEEFDETEFEEDESLSITLTDDEADELAAEISPESQPPDEEPQEPVAAANHDTAVSMGFIEVFNEQTWITEERQFFDDDSETLIIYSYKNNILVQAEAQKKIPGEEFRTAYVDYYRYNRSYSLRHVERRFHDTTYSQPVRLTFPGRVLDAAYEENFISDKLAVVSDFFGTFSTKEGYRVIYTTDTRGRILTQTMLNDKDEEVWVMSNTWLGDRITAMKRVEGDDERVTEYEYDDAGDRVVQRDIHNGVLERLVRTNGENETEELYLDGVLVLKAFWVDGRKISEERVRRR